MRNQINTARVLGFLENVHHRGARDSLAAVSGVNGDAADIDAIIRSHAIRSGPYDDLIFLYEEERVSADLPTRIFERAYWAVDPAGGFGLQGGKGVRVFRHRLLKYQVPSLDRP